MPTVESPASNVTINRGIKYWEILSVVVDCEKTLKGIIAADKWGVVFVNNYAGSYKTFMEKTIKDRPAFFFFVMACCDKITS